MNPNLRRDLLETTENPDSRIDYAVTLSGRVGFAQIAGYATTELRYVPHNLILEPSSFTAYLKNMSAMDWKNLESLATTIMSDINNEVVGRWVQVKLTLPDADPDQPASHAVLLEDRQPGWDNPSLLATLRQTGF